MDAAVALSFDSLVGGLGAIEVGMAFFVEGSQIEQQSLMAGGREWREAGCRESLMVSQRSVSKKLLDWKVAAKTVGGDKAVMSADILSVLVAHVTSALTPT